MPFCCLQGLAEDARRLLHFRRHNRRGAAITYALLTAALAGMGASCLLAPDLCLTVRPPKPASLHTPAGISQLVLSSYVHASFSLPLKRLAACPRLASSRLCGLLSFALLLACRCKLLPAALQALQDICLRAPYGRACMTRPLRLGCTCVACLYARL